MQGLERPIRVVIFGGAYLEPAARLFVARVATHPEIELVGVVCQSPGFELRHRLRNVLRRRGLMALPVLMAEAAQTIGRYVRHPLRSMQIDASVRRVLGEALAVDDIHAPAVIERVRSWAPDLGLIYGSPILRPDLFGIPRLGTLGVHQGSLPKYRGKKTTFWAMYNGERVAGVAIQRVNARLDAGEIVLEGHVTIDRKGYRRVDSEVQALGVDLYLDAIVAVKRGRAVFRSQPTGESVIYKQPRPGQFIELWRRRLWAPRT